MRGIGTKDWHSSWRRQEVARPNVGGKVRLRTLLTPARSRASRRSEFESIDRFGFKSAVSSDLAPLTLIDKMATTTGLLLPQTTIIDPLSCTLPLNANDKQRRARLSSGRPGAPPIEVRKILFGWFAKQGGEIPNSFGNSRKGARPR
jgi:hypothetical protein